MRRQHFYWLLTRFAKKLGIWGLLGLFLVIASLVFYAINIPAANHKIEEAKHARQRQTQQRDAQKATSEPTIQNAEEEAEDFYRRFPTIEGLPKILSQLNKIANQKNITLYVGDYQYKALKSKRSGKERALTKYKIVFPVEGQYTKIRAFISASLQALPAMALEDLQVVREDSQSQEVTARIAFVVFVRGESWSM